MSLKTIWKSLHFLLLIGLLTVTATGCLSVGAEPGSSDNHPDALVTVLEDEPGREESNDSLALEVGVEPTPVPTSYPYSSTSYGYQFSYPETWRVVEIDQGVEVWKDNARLVIQTWWDSELNPPVRWYGMPAGDLLYRDKLSFLGEILPVQYLVFGDKTKQVLYNDGKTITSGDLKILIYLEGQGSDYESVEVPETTIAEAKQVLESFQTSGLAAPPQELKGGLCATEKGNPPADWQLYQNEDYGFYLYYPESMQVTETGDHTLEFRQDNLYLRMEFRRIDQAYPLPGIISEGEVELTRFVNFFGDENPNPIVVERTGGLVTRVSVGNTFGSTTPVQFQVEITGTTGMDIDLDQADAMLEILDYLCLIF
jgi:hypothetical protein